MPDVDDRPAALQDEVTHVRVGVKQAMDAPPQRGPGGAVLRAVPDQPGIRPVERQTCPEAEVNGEQGGHRIILGETEPPDKTPDLPRLQHGARIGGGPRHDD
jgi:hypothetical protein